MHQIELKNHYVEETGDKNTNPPQVIDKLYHTIMYRVHLP